MKSESKIFIAFILNLAFSTFEFIGGIITRSSSIASDAIHDMSDAISIGISYIFEKKSKKKADEKYTYGYERFSVLGGLITSGFLFISCIFIIINAIPKLIKPTYINYNGMLIFAIIGVIVNFIATVTTKSGKSANQKAVNLHMLEDLLGWIAVLFGALIIKTTKLYIIDPILSIGVAIFIIIHSSKNLIDIFYIFMDKTPKNFDIASIKNNISKINGVKEIQYLRIRNSNNINLSVSIKISSSSNPEYVKFKIREQLTTYDIFDCTIETT